MKARALICLITALIICSCSADEKVIVLNQETQHDDFFYLVTDFYKTDEIGGQKAKGIFYVVTFKVVNRAKRVDHPWDNSITYVVDENGRQFHNLPEMQNALNFFKPFNLRDRHVTKAGETESTIFVFDIPNDSKQPYLKYEGDFLMGDMFDGSRFSRTKVKLY
jgi:hypothetical protein